MNLEYIMTMLGYTCTILFLLLIICIIIMAIYHYLQKIDSFWKICFLYFKVKLYYKDRQITLKSPEGKLYTIVEVKR